MMRCQLNLRSSHRQRQPIQRSRCSASGHMIAAMQHYNPPSGGPRTMRVPSMDWSELQKWQTLMAALAAAGLTYRGAMAKVRLDQQSERKDEHRRKLGLLRQLQFIAESLKEDSAELLGIWRSTGPDTQ